MELEFSMFKSFLDSVQSLTGEELKKAKRLLEKEGKDISDIDEIFANNNGELFELLPDGTLIRVNLYIATKEVDRYHFNINTIDKEDLFKYHIYKCKTISKMFNSGRKHRYKINNRDDGTFYYKFTDNIGNVVEINENQELNICKNCLAKYLGKKTAANDKEVNNFKLKDFHQQESNFFTEDISKLEKGEYAKPNTYTKFWNKISTQLKIKKDYTCENCGFKANSEYEKRYIHTHHINGDKQNNYEDNLKVLCIKCHSEVDYFHSIIRSNKYYKEYMIKYKI